jgi:hypothetical protein
MNDAPFFPAFQRGTATGYSPTGLKLLTVTAATVESPLPMIHRVLEMTSANHSPYAGEPLARYAQRVAAAAGLTVAKWELSGNDEEDPAVPGEEDRIY